MDNENTIPSQLGPVNTIPAPLSAMSGRTGLVTEANAGSGLLPKILVAVLALVLMVYLFG